MTWRVNHPMARASKGGKAMGFLIPLGVLVVWIILQAWALPRLGIKT